MTEDSIIFTPEKSKKIALARLDLLYQWKEFRRKSDNKLQADYDFVNLHNTSNSHLFEVLGKISRGTLHRWKNILNGTEDYTKLIPQYKYAKVDEYRTCLTDEEIKIFMGLLLHPNRLCIGKAIALTKYKLKEQGQSYIPADITFRKYANWFKKNNYDKWVLARDGEKALSDKVEPYIKRDASLLEVGDILVADGHNLAFNVINPFTGKPTRATLVGFLDWKSTALVGYEIMLEETKVKTIQRNGIRFLNCDYFDERLYGFKSKVLIKYNLFDLKSIKVFTTKCEYLCTAGRVTETHPMAKLLGTVKDFEDYKQKIVKQRKLHKDLNHMIIKINKNLLKNKVCDETTIKKVIMSYIKTQRI